MTGAGGLTLGGGASAGRTHCRWVGRAGVLAARPHLPQWTRYFALTVCYTGLQLIWTCEMARGMYCAL